MSISRTAIGAVLLSLATSPTLAAGVGTLCTLDEFSAPDSGSCYGWTQFFSGNSPSGTATTEAEAGFGVLHAHIVATADTAGNGFSGSAGAMWHEEVTINAPGLDHQRGGFYFSFFEEGWMDASGDGRVLGGTGIRMYDPSYELPGIPTDTGSIQFGTPLVTAANAPLPFSRQVEGFASFYFGETFGLEMFLTLSAGFPNTGTTGPSYAEGFFRNTSYWNGISAIVDQDGNPVDFSISTLGGTNITQSYVPTPGPASLPLLGTALAAAAGFAARSKNRRPAGG